MNAKKLMYPTQVKRDKLTKSQYETFKRISALRAQPYASISLQLENLILTYGLETVYNILNEIKQER